MSSDSRTTTVLRWIVPSFGSLLVLGALGSALLLRREWLFSGDGDVGRHIRVGRTILETGVIPDVDLFSHTRAGTPFVPYEWLSEAVTALAHAAAGLAGVAILTAILYAVAILCAYRIAEELGAPRFLGLLIGLLALLLQAMHLLPRPHLFTTAFAAVFTLVLLRYASSGRGWDLVPLPVLMLAWANLHGGFLIGFILLAAFLFGALLESPEFATGRRAGRPLAITLVACVAASLINPVGPELWRHTTGYLGIDFLIAQTQEYQSVDFHGGFGKLFFVALFAGPALWMTGRVRVTWLGAGLYLFFGAAALHSARNVPLYTVTALPFVAVWAKDALRAGGPAGSRTLSRMKRFEKIDRTLQPGMSTVAVLGLVWYCLGPAAATYRFSSDFFPVEALRTMPTDETSGPVFNQMRWGGYILYAHPDIPVFIDGQTDFYGEELAREYLTVVNGLPGWEAVLDGYEVTWTLTLRGEPINQILELHDDWEPTYTGNIAQAFRRTTDR